MTSCFPLYWYINASISTGDVSFWFFVGLGGFGFGFGFWFGFGLVVFLTA